MAEIPAEGVTVLALEKPRAAARAIRVSFIVIIYYYIEGGGRASK